MYYDFNKRINRHGTHSVKWEGQAKNVIPMWIADMDFEVAAPILDALKTRMEHGIFGYTVIPHQYYKAEVDWWLNRHGFKIKKEWIDVTTGIIPALSSIVQAFTNPGDKVMIQSPVYNYFNTSITNNGCLVVENELVYEKGHYRIDFEDFEEKASDDKVKVFILCSPHNPVGRVWSKRDLLRMGEICLRHNVLVVVDEAHRDLVHSGHQHIPFASLKEDFTWNSVTCTAPSKTFNIAGLKTANIISPNPEIREKVNRSININEVIEPNTFGIEALIAAYEKGGEWLDQLLLYLEDNLDHLMSFIDKELPEIKVARPQATYLVWLDCRSLNMSSHDLKQFILEQGLVHLSEGSTYGRQGEGFLRLNFACPRHVLDEGLKGIKHAVDLIKREAKSFE